MSQDTTRPDAPSRKSSPESPGANTGLPSEATSDPQAVHAPVTGTCGACGCALGYGACRHEGTWYCCGGCAGSGRCVCGCDAEFTRGSIGSDRYVPTRRMFGSRRPDELRGDGGPRSRQRAFPFADRRRGR